jgi:ABC-type Fe3+-citrate transport system substrate-binding protein
MKKRIFLKAAGILAMIVVLVLVMSCGGKSRSGAANSSSLTEEDFDFGLSNGGEGVVIAKYNGKIF